MDILGRLFGSPLRVKLLRLFILNPETVFETREARRRIKARSGLVRRELNLLAAVGFIRLKKTTIILTPVLAESKQRPRRRKIEGWQLDQNFPLLINLKLLLGTDLLYKQEELAERFSRCGKVKLLAVAGVFLQELNSRVDLLLVGDGLKRGIIDRVIRDLEAEVGKELNYAVLTTGDFQYRLNASDKFVRDIFDYPHERVINKLNWS